MTDKFTLWPLTDLLQLILHQHGTAGHIFGIPGDLFFKPENSDPFRMTRFGQTLETPIGVAAGPHTQLSQNIVAAWLTGARFIELKTIQTLDELEVSKPCIDMPDEGYNCEWSQELKIHESFGQYLDAWILLHILNHKLHGAKREMPGFIFNMSVGYDFAGIMKPNVQWFLDKMKDAGKMLQQKIEAVRPLYPEIDKIKINPMLSDNITLSTMHGCPPDEIEKIAQYLITERQLHTAIKLNPTLLGREQVQEIMQHSGFKTQVPDSAFAHDLKYTDAVPMIRRLQKLADDRHLCFSLKLTNTLESVNNRKVFDASQNMMYMSGRPLHVIAVQLARKLQMDFDGKLDISFCGGADAFNVADLVKSGLAPITVCTDLLKPGGYGRLAQYIHNLRQPDFFASDLSEASHLNLYTERVINDPAYRNEHLLPRDIKTQRPLGFFDCISAPCQSACPTTQDIPGYMYFTANQDLTNAARVIHNTNPFPDTTGAVCDHLCQTKCTRMNYDTSVLIREVKRVVADHAPAEAWQPAKAERTDVPPRAAIIGAGPSGLSCAWFLRLAGFDVEVYEARNLPGGMVAGAIPEFRLTPPMFETDVNRIMEAGVKVHFNTLVNQALFENLRIQNDYVYIAAGAQKSRMLVLPGDPGDSLLDPLEFLFDVKSGSPKKFTGDVLIIGGGNTAMDAARTTWRLTQPPSVVRIAYRRTIADMPADQGEIKAVLEEGIQIIEQVAPVEFISENGKLKYVRFRKMKAGKPDASGRATPVEVTGSDFFIPAATVIPAIGQETDIPFIEASQLPKPGSGSYQTALSGVFAGGDAMRGASTAINAIGDGRKAAAEIINLAAIKTKPLDVAPRELTPFLQHIVNRSQRIHSSVVEELPVAERRNFAVVQKPLTLQQGIGEASRCLLCDEVCSICTTVCPNLALFTYHIQPIFQRNSVYRFRKGKIIKDDARKFSTHQPHQILHIADWCNQCGNCTTFCPTAGAPYLQKPHLYLDEENWLAQVDGFFFNKEILKFKNGTTESALQKDKNSYTFRLPEMTFKLDNDFELKEVITEKSEDFDIDMELANQMNIIYQGAAEFFAYRKMDH
jgi:putative selenate reductase